MDELESGLSECKFTVLDSATDATSTNATSAASGIIVNESKDNIPGTLVRNGISRINKGLTQDPALVDNFHSINQSHRHIRQELLSSYVPHQAIVAHIEHVRQSSSVATGASAAAAAVVAPVAVGTSGRDGVGGAPGSVPSGPSAPGRFSSCAHVEGETREILQSIHPGNVHTYKHTVHQVTNRYICVSVC